MLDHVLVPLDGSELAEAALPVARQVVAPQGRITLVSVVTLPELPIYDFYPAPTIVAKDFEHAIAEAVPRVKNYLERVANELRLDSERSVVTLVEAGDPAAVIISQAQRLHCNAIVMSTHGRSGLGLWLFGSVTHKVLAAVACPVLVVPSRKPQLLPQDAAEVAIS